jgi:hypothetical protein
MANLTLTQRITGFIRFGTVNAKLGVKRHTSSWVLDAVHS